MPRLKRTLPSSPPVPMKSMAVAIAPDIEYVWGTPTIAGPGNSVQVQLYRYTYVFGGPPLLVPAETQVAGSTDAQDDAGRIRSAVFTGATSWSCDDAGLFTLIWGTAPAQYDIITMRPGVATAYVKSGGRVPALYKVIP